jgi:hypothetical protein
MNKEMIRIEAAVGLLICHLIDEGFIHPKCIPWEVPFNHDQGQEEVPPRAGSVRHADGDEVINTS